MDLWACHLDGKKFKDCDEFKISCRKNVTNLKKGQPDPNPYFAGAVPLMHSLCHRL